MLILMSALTYHIISDGGKSIGHGERYLCGQINESSIKSVKLWNAAQGELFLLKGRSKGWGSAMYIGASNASVVYTSGIGASRCTRTMYTENGSSGILVNYASLRLMLSFSYVFWPVV